MMMNDDIDDNNMVHKLNMFGMYFFINLNIFGINAM